jgi:small conductance mechanosensitive channel
MNRQGVIKMDARTLLKNLVEQVDWPGVAAAGVRIAIVLVVTLIALRIQHRLLDRLARHMLQKSTEEGEPPSESNKRVETLVRLLRQGVVLAIWMAAVLIILNELNIKIGPILAGAGVLGLAIGFGAQNLVRDVISGFFIILENQIRVGDVAIINGTGGLVEKIRFRTTILRDLGGIVHIFPNGTINTLSNLTNEWSAYIFDIGVAYKENTDRVMEVMASVGSDMMKDPEFGRLMLEEPEIFGVDKFGDSAVVIKGRIRTQPIRQWAVGREYLRRIKHAFDEHGIEIPFPHRTVYFGEASKPFELQVLEKYRGGEEKENA